MLDIFGNNNIEVGVGVDIGYNTIKVVELIKDKGGISIQNYGDIELSLYNGSEFGLSANLGDQTLSKALKELFDKTKVSIKNVYVAVPSIESYLFTIHVKPTEGIDIKNIIELEIRKYIPIPIAELIVDHWVIDDKGEQMHLSVIVVKRSIVDRYIKIFKDAGLNILGFEMETFAAVRSLKLLDKNYMLIDTGGAYTTATLISHGVLYKSVTVQIGGNNVTSVIKNSRIKNSYKDTEIIKRKLIDGELMDGFMANVLDIATYPLLEELGHIGKNLEREYNLSIDEVVFIGGNARSCVNNSKTKDCFQNQIRLGNGFADLRYPEYISDLMARVGPSYAIATGLADKSFVKNK